MSLRIASQLARAVARVPQSHYPPSQQRLGRAEARVGDASLEQPRLREAHVSRATYHYMVVNGNVEKAPGTD